MKTNLQRVVLAVSLAVVPVFSFAGTMTGGATFPEQIVQEVTEVQTKVTEAQQLVQEIQQYENMVQNMATLPQSMMNQIMQPVNQLYGLAQQAQALGTAGQNISSEFQNMNVGFNPQATSNFEQQYSGTTDNLNSAINSALQSANLNPSNFLTQQQSMAAITSAMQDPTSRNAILQAGVTVGQAEVSDLTQMAQTATAQETMQAAYAKDKVAQQNNNVEAGENALKNGLAGGPLESNSQPLSDFSLSGYHH